jgi:hypothetical protein
MAVLAAAAAWRAVFLQELHFWAVQAQVAKVILAAKHTMSAPLALPTEAVAAVAISQQGKMVLLVAMAVMVTA